jgi:DNA mismatch endonuclease (patch repair protein)
VNMARDRRNSAAAHEAGWDVIRVWECEIRRDPQAAALRVRAAAAGGSASSEAEPPAQKS